MRFFAFDSSLKFRRSSATFNRSSVFHGYMLIYGYLRKMALLGSVGSEVG